MPTINGSKAAAALSQLYCFLFSERTGISCMMACLMFSMSAAGATSVASVARASSQSKSSFSSSLVQLPCWYFCKRDVRSFLSI